MTKICFFDIDGTLAIHKHITEENLECLKLLKENGVITFICTGRAPFYAKHLFKDLVSGYICCNGRYILYNNEKLHGEAFSKEELHYYKETFDQLNAGYFLVSDDVSYIHNIPEKYLDSVYNDYGKEHITTIDNALNYYTFDIFYNDLNHRDLIIETLKDKIVFNDHGGHGSGDCSTVGYDKGSAIAYCLKHFNISKDDSYAFGDGYNDIAMFRVVGNKIAMGNGVNELKGKATYITTNIDDHGIKNALLHFNLLKE